MKRDRSRQISKPYGGAGIQSKKNCVSVSSPVCVYSISISLHTYRYEHITQSSVNLLSVQASGKIGNDRTIRHGRHHGEVVHALSFEQTQHFGRFEGDLPATQQVRKKNSLGLRKERKGMMIGVWKSGKGLYVSTRRSKGDSSFLNDRGN